jgi:hypothetical protein
MPFYLSRATLLAPLILMMVLQVQGQRRDFEVSCDSLPDGWKAGEQRSGSFSASRQTEKPSRWGRVSVSESSPMTLEEAKNNVPPHPDNAVISWETIKFRERPAFVYHMRDNTELLLANNQGFLIEFDRYFIQLEGDTWARIDLDRSCSHSRAVMLDGSEIPPGTVPMPYEVKSIPVNFEAEVIQLKAEEEQILNCLKFTVSGASGSTTQPVPTGPGDSEEVPWGLVVGVGGAAAVVAAAAAAAIKAAANKNKPKGKTAATPNKAQTKEKKSEPKQPVVYVLQLSSDHLTVTENAPAPLTVQVWKVDPKTKTCQTASEAVIDASPPSGLPMLQLSGRPSPGRLDCQLQLGGPVQISQAVLQVRAQAGGSSHGADVRLTFDSPITMEFF